MTKLVRDDAPIRELSHVATLMSASDPVKFYLQSATSQALSYWHEFVSHFSKTIHRVG